MKLHLFPLFTTLLPLLVVGDDVILTQETQLIAGNNLFTQDGRCHLKLQQDGNLRTWRRGPFWNNPTTPDPIEESPSWSSGPGRVAGGDYKLIIEEGGNLQVRFSYNEEVVWSTNVFPSTQDGATHDLVFTDKCTLKIIRHEPSGDTLTVWRNIHEWFDNFSADEYPGLDNVIRKGEYYTSPLHNHGTVCGTDANFCFEVPYFLRLQHDCNLKVFVGHDRGDAAATVWSAKAPRPNATDCYLLVDSQDVALYEGSFDISAPVDSSRPGKYWSVPSSFFDVDGYNPGSTNRYQVLINSKGQLYLDWD